MIELLTILQLLEWAIILYKPTVYNNTMQFYFFSYWEYHWLTEFYNSYHIQLYMILSDANLNNKFFV